MAAPRKIRTLDELATLRALLHASEERAKRALIAVLERKSPLRALKFERLGCDPWDLAVSQNLAEQIDQQATHEVALDALEWLMTRHPGLEWEVAPGAYAHISSHDIVSEDRSVAAEVFAAVKASNNNKLRNDIDKLAGAQYAYKYVFYRDAALSTSERQDGTVLVVSFGA